MDDGRHTRGSSVFEHCVSVSSWAGQPELSRNAAPCCTRSPRLPAAHRTCAVFSAIQHEAGIVRSAVRMVQQRAPLENLQRGRALHVQMPCSPAGCVDVNGMEARTHTETQGRDTEATRALTSDMARSINASKPARTAASSRGCAPHQVLTDEADCMCAIGVQAGAMCAAPATSCERNLRRSICCCMSFLMDSTLCWAALGLDRAYPCCVDTAVRRLLGSLARQYTRYMQAAHACGSDGETSVKAANSFQGA